MQWIVIVYHVMLFYSALAGASVPCTLWFPEKPHRGAQICLLCCLLDATGSNSHTGASIQPRTLARIMRNQKLRDPFKLLDAVCV